MNETDQNTTPPDREASTVDRPGPQPDHTAAVRQQRRDRSEARRWWIKLIVQPALLLVFGVILFIGLGVAQRHGFISAGGSGGHSTTSNAGDSVRYICPMMCTPPQSEPGRCPVCAMELVPATSGGGDSDSQSVRIDPAARRVANIRTVSVKSMPMNRTLRVIGELSYDEGTLKSLAAYVDGRLERLYADYTGVSVAKGDRLALVYSPQLYSGQVELLLAKKAQGDRGLASHRLVAQSNRTLYQVAKHRLIEMGMTQSQLDQLEQAGEANSRMHLYAPISGTVIEKLAVEGQYVKEGQAIYKLADLSTVWLMLELFPKDAATIRYGQKVQAVVQSLPGETFAGRVAFIDPHVDPNTRTVGVRVVIPNADGQLRVGDYAKATIDVPITTYGEHGGGIYDSELADKWISPRHPHVVESSAGQCRVCGVDLVPAATFGFVTEANSASDVLVVPRDAVLMAGENSVIYVETEPGRFEIRRVVLGANCGDQIVVLSGLNEGEQVATRGNFLIDSQMQLAGNPSLIDPRKAQPKTDEFFTDEMIAALADLSAEDRRLAETQRICPVTKMPLGSMGPPPKVDVSGRAVFICCQGCADSLLEDPETYLANLSSIDDLDSDDEKAITFALSKLAPADRELALRQRTCPVADFRLGAMGPPKKVDVNGTPVFICCDGCRESLLAEPDKYLAILANSDAAGDSPGEVMMDLPPIGVPEAFSNDSGLPPIMTPQAVIEPSTGARPESPIAEQPGEIVR